MGGTCCASEGALAQFAKSHLDERFGIGTSDALQRIVELVVQAELKIQGRRMTSHPFIVNLGMMLRQSEMEKRYTKPITSGVAFQEAKILRKAARYARYAAAAYQNDKKSISSYVGNLRTEDIRHVTDNNNTLVMTPGYFVAIDTEFDDIVLTIRGAGRAAEALADAVSPKEPLLGGSAHASLLEGARQVVDSSVKLLMRLSQEFPRKSIAIVGHSLGAGIASLVTVLLSSEGAPFAKLMATGKVKCFAFAPPPVFEPLWALPAWVHGCTYSFVYNMDCVPRTCMGTVSKLYMALKHVDGLPLAPERRLAYISGECQIDYVLPDYRELPANLGSAAGSLFVVGTILALYREGGQVRCEAVAPHMMDRLLLHPDMVHDHAVCCFEEAFEDLRLQVSDAEGCVLS
mmetsp:Transcript_9653/g.34335  ORF Transcript_9653/g.34335 Transcript_9653/m.34335 type:complete len:403 (-) Transcript_9653:67-1275(-)